MTLSELHNKLQETGVPSESYYLHGLYGSSNDDGKVALSINRGKHFIEYEIYRMSRGQRTTENVFTEESKACEYLFKKIRDSWILKKIHQIQDLKNMSIEARLVASGLKDEFEYCLAHDKTRAVYLLRWLEVEQSVINSLVH
ncbi:hypothetical protein [Muriicola jejuensis]|uniref:Uncharacterized protein n=1 Tax=Muriicola jejuensis TaxID=504488 RepID=A0A6P0UIY7_9FLAO|nr:hypothetical protein [Muriicola jejuensis]NER11799.1 hypothetical protein [Muriicola jejuensis]